MKIFYLNAWIKKMGLTIVIIPLLFAFPNTVLSQVVAKNPLCYGEPVQLKCNFNAGCSSPGATFTWHNTNSSWITHVKNPVLYPPGGFDIGDGQTADGSSLCNGEGYATDSIFLTIHYAPPPAGFYSGSVHVMINSPYVDISGTAYAYIGNQYYPLDGGHAYLFNSINGVLDTLVTVPVNNVGQFTVHNTCGVDGSPILIIPNGDAQIPTYLGDAVSWNDATAVVASSTVNVGAIHMIDYAPQIITDVAAFIKGIVYKNTSAKANDPIDNVGVVIKKSASLRGYATSDDNGLFTLGKFEQGDYSINSNYPGIPMYTRNGANIIRVFNPIDTINLTISVVCDSVMVDSNFIRVSPTYVVSPSCSVQDEVITNGYTTCYNALQNLIVSGSDPDGVVVNNGGTAYFVAGQKINFKQGFRVENGSSVWGHITTTGQFCSQLLGSNNSLGGMTISGGESRCFQAMDALSTGANGATFLVKNGATAHLTAGKKIVMYPNTHAASGASFHAYISTDGTYCNEPKAPVTDYDGNEDAIAEKEPSLDHQAFFKVYPDPTSGSFTLELSAEPGESTVSVTCYNNMGSLVMEKDFFSGKKHELSLAGHAPGIYLLRVRMNGNTGIKKMIKQ
ncbi:MAG: T9SS type A sorting domain-containing protein [Bacteroidetes bacterium]|nr:T9SS type A sorting domain-containing protein [Bacteroidota bacterium]